MKKDPVHRPKAPSKSAIRRAVASSTAIETRKPVARIESQLRAQQKGKSRDLKLAS